MTTTPRQSRRTLRPSGKLLAEDARRHHQSVILQRLYTDGPASRADLARATGLTRVTVSDLVAESIDDGLLTEMGPPVGVRVGKPPILVGIDASARQILAVDLAAEERFSGTVRDLLGHEIARIELPRNGATGDEALALTFDLVGQLLEAATAPVLGLGVGAPGVVDPGGVIVSATNLGWSDVHLAEVLSENFDLPAYVANDARTAALGEHTFGEASGDDLILVRVANGAGAGLIVGGALVRGHRSAAGEIGHVMVDPQGAPCGCGRVGCLETVLSERAVRSMDVEERAAAGRTLGMVLAPIVAALNLHEIVLNGPTDRLEGALVDAVRETVSERMMRVPDDDLIVRTSALGMESVLAGAVVLVLSGELGIS